METSPSACNTLCELFKTTEYFPSVNKLTIHKWKNLRFTEFSTKIIEVQGWLFLALFMCLHNQLSSFNSIIVQMSEKRDSSVVDSTSPR